VSALLARWPDHAAEVSAALASLGPFEVLARLGVEHRREGPAARLLCPFHAERTPSATFHVGPAGTLRLRCHGACGRSRDVFALVAFARGLSTKGRDFPRVLLEAARLAGLYALGEELSGVTEGAYAAPRPKFLRPLPTFERNYPPRDEIETLWDAAGHVIDDSEASAYLEGRGICPERATDGGLVRVLARGAELPRWARFRGGRSEARPWSELGFRLVLPVYDPFGEMRAVRAWRIGGDASDPKRVPPAGYKATGLVLACPLARLMLEVGALPSWWPEREPLRVLITEGEPDFLTWAARFSDADATAPAVLGVVSGSWSAELAGRVPDGARVIVRTHRDAAGDRYAREVAESLGGRCDVRDVVDRSERMAS
jgi:hypothetical protein